MFRDLETERLLLVSISPADREFILREFSCDQVNRYLFDAEPMASLADADELIAFYNEPEPRAQHRWILVRKSDGEKIGTCGFHCWWREKGECELGYDMLPAYQGMGYMAEALREILRFADENMGLSKIVTHVYPDNVRSAKASLRQGFYLTDEHAVCTFRGRDYVHDVYARVTPRQGTGE